jgi:hypothetical protein
MRRAGIVWSLIAASVLLAGRAQAQMPSPPQPGPEHDLLKKDVGVWDATVEMSAGPPGTAPMVSKGTETVTLAVGGMWQVTEFKGELMGAPFEGRGLMGFDPGKKKYVGSWVDSMTPSISPMEASYDPATKTMTGWMEAPDPTGKLTKSKHTTEWRDADTRVFNMFMTAPDGKEYPVLKITYKRQK